MAQQQNKLRECCLSKRVCGFLATSVPIFIKCSLRSYDLCRIILEGTEHRSNWLNWFVIPWFKLKFTFCEKAIWRVKKYKLISVFYTNSYMSCIKLACGNYTSDDILTSAHQVEIDLTFHSYFQGCNTHLMLNISLGSFASSVESLTSCNMIDGFILLQAWNWDLCVGT